MRGLALGMAMAAAVVPMTMMAQQAGPYKVLSTTKVGGEGSFDYVYADATNRKLYIPRLGTAGQITEAFRTEIHHLDVKGEKHFANMQDPSIPEALSSVVDLAQE